MKAVLPLLVDVTQVDIVKLGQFLDVTIIIHHCRRYENRGGQVCTRFRRIVKDEGGGWVVSSETGSHQGSVPIAVFGVDLRKGKKALSVLKGRGDSSVFYIEAGTFHNEIHHFQGGLR